MNLPWRRIFGFSSLPILSALSPLLVLPVLTRTVGAPGWASIAIGQSIGMAAALVVNYGWGVTGPSEIARADPNGRRDIYRISLVHRSLVSIVVLPAAFCLAQFLDPASGDAGAGVMAVAMALAGLSPSWYFIGSGKPWGIAIYDTFPRLVGSLLAIPLLQLVPDVLTYPLTLLVFVLAGVMISAIRLASRGNSVQHDLILVRKHHRSQTTLVLSGLISAGYTSLSVSLVAGTNYSAVAAFAAADRLRAMAKQGTVSLGNALQGWVAEDHQWVRARRRMIVSLGLLASSGLLVGTLVWIGLPIVDESLFGPAIVITQATSFFCGASLLFTAVTISLSFHILAPALRTNVIAIATTSGALIGVPLILILSTTHGAPGAALAGAIAEGVVLVVEAVAAWKILRLTRPSSPWT
jgi:O-antigen/teichoic acid export membrane protein